MHRFSKFVRPGVSPDFIARCHSACCSPSAIIGASFATSMSADCRAIGAACAAAQAGMARASARLAGPRAETHFFGQFTPLCGVTGGDHGIIRGQSPARAILLGCQAVGLPEMPAQHFQFLAVFEADEEIARYGASDRHRRMARVSDKFLFLRRCGGKRSMYVLDEIGQRIGRYAIIRDM